MILSEREIYEIAFNRNISDNMLLPAQIEAAHKAWIIDFVGINFAAKLEVNEDGLLTDVIENHIKKIWAFGVLHNNFYHITMNVTDKGIIQMLVEGTANVMSDTKLATAKREIKSTLYRLLENLDYYCVKNDIAGWEGLKLPTSHTVFMGRERMNEEIY